MTDAPVSSRWPDDARRLSDTVRLHITFGKAGQWLAVKLSDGSSDTTLYETRADAVAHQLHETQCAYVKIPRDDMSPRSAMTFLEMHRRLYDAGYRLQDPDDVRAVFAGTTNDYLGIPQRRGYA
jgi:hypothetical protein